MIAAHLAKLPFMRQPKHGQGVLKFERPEKPKKSDEREDRPL